MMNAQYLQSRPKPPRSLRGQRGFTLIEAAIVTAIVGIGCVSMVRLLAAGTMSNANANNLTMGLNIANNFRELTQSVAFTSPTSPTNWGPEFGETLSTYDDLDDFDGMTFSPPIDARRQPLAGFLTWSQTIKVESVDPNRLTLVVPHGSLTPDQRPMSRITVTINHQGALVCQTSWLVAYTQ
ncbi:MAG TPA: prepilin-type N-terminal cleavage/methylation domain-containing protein [Tepidisphaeraceae bacterium]|jgi:prepilin-type N-terminal cleavage/methylation domain-containing protein